MTTQPEALRHAEWLGKSLTIGAKEAAVELRRLHQSEHEGWRHADELEQERKRLHEANQAMLDALKNLADAVQQPALPEYVAARAAIAKGEQQ